MRVQTGQVKRRRVLIGLALAFVLAVAAVVLWPGERAPEYQGKKLSEWLEMRGPHTGTVAAIRQIGTNGMPFLVRWLGYETPRWKQWIFRSCTNLPSALKNTAFCGRLSEDQQKYSADKAMMALLSFGREEVLTVVKDLARIEANRNAPVASRRAYVVMAVIGHTLRDEDKQGLWPPWFDLTNYPPVPDGFEPWLGGGEGDDSFHKRLAEAQISMMLGKARKDSDLRLGSAATNTVPMIVPRIKMNGAGGH